MIKKQRNSLIFSFQILCSLYNNTMPKTSWGTVDQRPLGDAIQTLEQAHYALSHIFVQSLGKDIGVTLIMATDDTEHFK